MTSDPSIVGWIQTLLGSPQVQSAIIAAVISLAVASLTTRRERRARLTQRVERLLQDVYGPLDSFLFDRSLYGYVSDHRNVLERNRQSYSKAIAPIIDQALTMHYSKPMFGDEKDAAKMHDSQSALQSLETKLRPLLKEEISRLQALLKRESG